MVVIPKICRFVSRVGMHDRNEHNFLFEEAFNSDRNQSKWTSKKENRLSFGNLIMPILYSAVFLFGEPSTCYGMSLIVDSPGPMLLYDVQSATSALTNTARLLVDSPTSGFTQKQSNAMQQLSKKEALQDRRLEQCQEGGKDWEQCFFYGTTPSSNNEGLPINSSNARTTKSKIPTW